MGRNLQVPPAWIEGSELSLVCGTGNSRGMAGQESGKSRKGGVAGMLVKDQATQRAWRHENVRL